MEHAPEAFFSLHRQGFVRVAACTPRICIADPKSNAQETLALMREGQTRNVDLMLFPELGISAYAIDDLLLQDALLDGVEAALKELVDASREVRAASAHAFEHQGAGDWASAILAAARVERDQEVLELQVRALATVELPDQASVVEWLSDLGQRPSTKPNVQRAINYALDLLEGGRARGDDAEAETYRPGMMIGLTHGRRQQPSRS